MLTASAFCLEHLQVVAFNADPAAFDGSTVLGNILGAHRQHFDGQIHSVPMPLEFDHQIPRVQVGSRDLTWSIAASPLRTVCEWRNIHNRQVVVVRETAIQAAGFLVAALQTCTKPYPRLGVVLQRYAETEDPMKTLIHRFCAPEAFQTDDPEAPFRNSSAFQIHNLKRYVMSPLGVRVNSWVRCKTGVVLSTDSPSAIVEQDINTPASDHQFSLEDFVAFAEAACNEANSILSKYFPEAA